MQSIFFSLLRQRAFLDQHLCQTDGFRRDGEKPNAVEKVVANISFLAVAPTGFLDNQRGGCEVVFVAMMGPPFESRLLMTGNDQVIAQRRGKIADNAGFEINGRFQGRVSFAIIWLHQGIQRLNDSIGISLQGLIG